MVVVGRRKFWGIFSKIVQNMPYCIKIAVFFASFKEVGRCKCLKDVGSKKYRKILERHRYFLHFFRKTLRGPQKFVGKRKSQKDVRRQTNIDRRSAGGTQNDVVRRKTRKDVVRLKIQRDVFPFF